MIFKILENEELKDLYPTLLKEKVFDTELPNSRLENIYEMDRLTPDGIIASLALDDNQNIIGIITCERTIQKPFNAFKVKDPFKLNSKIKTTEEWSFIPSGFICMFTKEEYRGKGIAREMLHNLENHLFKDAKYTYPNVPLFNAAAKAVSFIADHSLYSLPIDVDDRSVNFGSRINFLTEAINSMRNNEDIWSYKCSNKTFLPTPKHNQYKPK